MHSEELPIQAIIDDAEKPEAIESVIETVSEGEVEKKPASKSSLQEIGKELKECLLACESKDNPNDKVRLLLDFMKKILETPKPGLFKQFWQARPQAMSYFKDSIFKEQVDPILRAELWKEYTQLLDEAKVVRDRMDEESAFAKEQIEVAIKALEEEISQKLSQALESTELKLPAPLAKHHTTYASDHAVLSLLGTYATRIMSLRKELVDLPMRLKDKNSFFKRLSELGNQVFPRRKDLVKKTSDLFKADVESFVAKHFPEGRVVGAYFTLREEIKELQAVAKALHLNTQAFNATRGLLSTAWDKVRELEKEKKEERKQKKEKLQELETQVAEKAQAVIAKFEAKELSAESAMAAMKDVLDFVFKIEAHKEEKQALKELVFRERKKIEEVLHQEENAKKQQEKERHDARNKEINDRVSSLEALLESMNDLSLEEAAAAWQAAVQAIEKLSLGRHERALFDRPFKKGRDVLRQKKERLVMESATQSPDGEKLAEILEMLVKERDELRSKIEELRRQQGASSLDFAKALHYSELLKEEKEAMKRLENSIEEIEEKLAGLEA